MNLPFALVAITWNFDDWIPAADGIVRRYVDVTGTLRIEQVLLMHLPLDSAAMKLLNSIVLLFSTTRVVVLSGYYCPFVQDDSSFSEKQSEST